MYMKLGNLSVTSKSSNLRWETAFEGYDFSLEPTLFQKEKNIYVNKINLHILIVMQVILRILLNGQFYFWINLNI